MNPNAPAFPRPASEDTTQGTQHDGNVTEAAQVGITLRAYLAGRAMQGLLSQHVTQETDSGARDFEPLFCGNNVTDRENACKYAVKWADQLIAELSKPQAVSRRPDCPNCSDETAAEYPCPVCGARPGK